MASAGYEPAGYGSGPRDQSRSMISHVKTLLNARLKEVLRSENLGVSGLKSELQGRLISHIQNLSEAGDQGGLQRLHNRIYGQYNTNYRQTYSSPDSSYSFTPPSSASPQYSGATSSYLGHHSGGSRTMPPYSPYSKQLAFRNSPFYEIIRSLTPVIECKARESTRDTARANIDLPADVADQINRDPNYRVMVFCAGDNSLPSYTPSDISFPHQVELKCNGNEVKANLRGLKNKPGSTRPADITGFIRKKVPGFQNALEMVYALTTRIDHAEQTKPSMQKFFLVANLVRKIPVETLVVQLKTGRIITKERVIKEMTSKAEDADIVATASVLSLKCPLSAMRIATPCRSTTCAHNQCFDASSYLQLQEQAPTWTCPICNRHAPFNSLTIDLYVDDILKSTSSSTDQVTIEPDGTWQRPSDATGPHSNPTPNDDDDDDDLIEIRDDRLSILKNDARSSTMARTPPMSSREQSTASSLPRSNKRPASEVIDLTLSDDDEAPPPSKIKRSSMSSPVVALTASPNGFRFPFPSLYDSNHDNRSSPL